MTAPAGVALAAGAGTRLRPLTHLRPKALCPVGNVALLDHALDTLRPHTGDGPGALAVNAHHMAAQIVAHVGDRAHTVVERPVALGTAGALGGLRSWLDGRDVLVINADAYLPAGIGALLPGWDRERCRLLVVPADGAGDFRDAAGTVRYVGACLLPWHLVKDLEPVPTGLYEVLWRREVAEGRLDLVRTDDMAIDCGTPHDYLAANLHAAGGASLVAEGARITGVADHSVIGSGAVVAGHVERCVVWDGAHVGSGEHLTGCVRAGTRRAPVTVPAAGSIGGTHGSPAAG